MSEDTHSVRADVLAARVATFTPREQKVLRLVAAGHGRREIAREVGVTPRTVKHYLDTLRLKLGVATARELPLAYMQATGDDPFPRPGEGEAA